MRFYGTKGFTLIELLVVVLILGALAAIVIPRFIGVEEEAEIAAATANIGKVNEIVNGHLALTDRIPDGLDSLVQGSTLLIGDLNGAISPVPINDNNKLQAIQNLGLGNVYEGGNDVTPLTTSTNVAQITKSIKTFVGGAFQDLLVPNKDCMIFGLGSHMMPYEQNNAAVSFEKPGTFPGLDSNQYNSYLILISYDTNTQTAEYIGCIDPLFQGQG